MMFLTEPRLSPQVRPRTRRRRWKKTPFPTDPSGVWGGGCSLWGCWGGSFGAAPRSALNKGAGPGPGGAQLLLGAWSVDKGAWLGAGGVVMVGMGGPPRVGAWPDLIWKSRAGRKGGGTVPCPCAPVGPFAFPDWLSPC